MNATPERLNDLVRVTLGAPAHNFEDALAFADWDRPSATVELLAEVVHLLDQALNDREKVEDDLVRLHDLLSHELRQFAGRTQATADAVSALLHPLATVPEGAGGFAGVELAGHGGSTSSVGRTPEGRPAAGSASPDSAAGSGGDSR